MQLHVTKEHQPDVLEGREPPDRPAWRVPRLVVGGGLAVALGALVTGAVVLVAQDDTPAVVDASGSMIVNDGGSIIVDRPDSTQQEGRDAVWTGTIRLDLPDGQLVGEVVQRFSWAGTAEDDVILISHSWGRMDVTFGDTACSGPFAKSAYREPRETGGAMSLRCDDGSLFAATMVLERDEDATAAHPFRVFYDLADGSYVAG